MKASLLERISAAQLTSRKNRDNPVVTSLLTTLLSEATMVGKNKGNRASTDPEVVAVIKKFVTNTRETISLLEKRFVAGATEASVIESIKNSKVELATLESFLPKQIEGDQLTFLIDEAIRAWPTVPTMKDMGDVMNEVRALTQGNCDMNVASAIVKQRLLTT